MSPGLENPFLRRAETRLALTWTQTSRANCAAGCPPSATPKRLQQKDIVRVHVRTYAAAIGRQAHHQIIEPGLRYETKARQQACAASSNRSTPCTSGVQRARRIDGKRRNRPCCSTRRRSNAVISRLSACALRASSNSRARSIGGLKAGNAPRISSGLRCQYSRMNCCADRTGRRRIGG